MMRHKVLFLVLFWVIATLAPSPASAQLAGDDTLPGESCAGLPEGATRLTADKDLEGSGVVLTCDGSVWRAVDNIVTKIDPSSLPCSSAADKGLVRYNNVSNLIEFCNGAGWQQIILESGAMPPSSPPGLGYFVMTETAWTGDLGGTAGANSKCLTELTTKTNWRGHGDALANGQLTPLKVQAWLAHTGINLLPMARYQYARVGDPDAGGALLYTNAQSHGPYTDTSGATTDSTSWAAPNRFGTSQTYWSGARGSTACGTAVFRDSCANGTCTTQICSVNTVHCDDHTNGTAGQTGVYGSSGAPSPSGNNAGRHFMNYSPCNVEHRLICIVHP